MSGPVKSPRILGRPMWSWAGALTTCWTLVMLPDGRQTCELTLRSRVARAVLWPLCRLLTGHRQALGETGYGGGGMLDVFCAYCHYPWQVPVSEMPSKQLLADVFHASQPPRERP